MIENRLQKLLPLQKVYNDDETRSNFHRSIIFLSIFFLCSLKWNLLAIIYRNWSTVKPFVTTFQIFGTRYSQTFRINLRGKKLAMPLVYRAKNAKTAVSCNRNWKHRCLRWIRVPGTLYIFIRIRIHWYVPIITCILSTISQNGMEQLFARAN